MRTTTSKSVHVTEIDNFGMTVTLHLVDSDGVKFDEHTYLARGCKHFCASCWADSTTDGLCCWCQETERLCRICEHGLKRGQR